MRELLLLLAAALFGLPIVLSNRLAELQPSMPVQPVVVTIPTVGPPRAPVPTPLPVPVADVPRDDRIATLMTAAQSWLGTRYLWGGCSRSGTDCSCFTRNVLAAIGINAPRVTWQQVTWVRPVSQPQAGDLIFFDDTCSGCGPNPTHVGMVMSPGVMIDAGDPVKIERYDTGRLKIHSIGRPPGL